MTDEKINPRLFFGARCIQNFLYQVREVVCDLLLKESSREILGSSTNQIVGFFKIIEVYCFSAISAFFFFFSLTPRILFFAGKKIFFQPNTQ